jgi:hypothetical protein
MHSMFLKVQLINYDPKLILLVQILKIVNYFKIVYINCLNIHIYVYLTHNENCSLDDISDVSSTSTIKHLALLILVTSFVRIISSQASIIWS